MNFKRIGTFLMTLAMIAGLAPGQTTFAADEREQRTVYVHAQGNPQETTNISTVYMGDTANVYLAVDNPNKGAYDVGTNTHLEPQYDMNGYTVKFYFDPIYFDYAGDYKNPINYQIPNEEWDGTSVTVNGTQITQTADVGYYVHAHASGVETINGTEYKTAYATILFSGTYLPQKPDDQLWYNLCNLPLTPKKTGYTEVFIADVGSGDYGLEILAKDVSAAYSPTFQVDTINGGHHQIHIKEKSKPAAPVANPIAGSYAETQKITLTAEEGCKIYYMLDNGTELEYTGPIDITRTSTIKCYAVRESDQKQSSTVSYTYTILPAPPSLFIQNAQGQKELLPNVYNDYKAFQVYAADQKVFGNISDDSEIYYTFSPSASAEDPVIGNDPQTQWVQVNKINQSINIAKTCTIRLITKKGEEYSEASWYMLGIRPEAVTASQNSGEYEKKFDVTLTTPTPGAKIYYTLDGSDPREASGILYGGTPLTIYRDTTLRAVAEYEGVTSDVSSWYYLFSNTDDYGIDAFYPAGIYEGSVNVTLMPATEGYEVYYTTDGQIWKKYQSGMILNITEDTTLQAYSQDANGKRGDIYSFIYQIKPLPPIFAPETTQFTNASQVTVYGPEPGKQYELFYTLDGSDPTISGIKAEGDAVTLPITQYTVISAVIKKDGKVYSKVIRHSYDIVTTKPVKPLTTLMPGLYVKKIEDTKDISTLFVPVPSGITLYYTIGTKGGSAYPPEDPVPGKEGTIQYVPGTEIPLHGETMIKAVAVNGFGAKSDIGIFAYTIAPEAPQLPPSAAVDGKLPVVPVKVVSGSTVHYDVNGVTNEFESEDATFYLDTATGNAYKDKECTQPLGKQNTGTIEEPAVIDIYSELDGVVGESTRVRYEVSAPGAAPAAPYANKDSGEYEQIAVDEDNNLLEVKLYSLNSDDQIQYMLNNDGIWREYTGGVKLQDDTVLQVRTERGEQFSEVRSYVYTFVPPAPVIELPSGTYSGTQYTKIRLDSRVPSNREYTIMYRRNGDRDDVRYTDVEIEVDHTMSVKAYVVDERSGRKSSNRINYYIIDSTAGMDGSVYVGYPYDQGTRYSADLLSQTPYSEGIKLMTANHKATINYYYSYTTTDGQSLATNNFVYENVPILTSKSMEKLSITAWLTDENDSEIPGSRKTFPFEFVHLQVPITSLEDAHKVEFPQGAQYTWINAYEGDDRVLLYYTTDGSDPAAEDNENRKMFLGEELSLNESTTLRAVYFSACGICSACKEGQIEDCWNGVYGEIGTYRYTIPSVVRGGSGGGVRGIPSATQSPEDSSRAYTKDIFGNEHPTHIGYIKGYPDGSVQADGQITREEIAAVLYRVKNKSYDAPFTTTGDKFPDVSSERWSATEVEYMAREGVLEGYPDGSFGPGRNLTRAEFAAMISRFANLKTENGENKFPDVNEDIWAYGYIQALHQAGLIDGYEDGTFRPENEITRAEVMSVMNRVLGRNPSEDYVKSLNFTPYNDLQENAWHYVIVLEATITHNYYLDDKGIEILWEDWK